MRILRSKRKQWDFREVVTLDVPEFAVRTYLEQRDLRGYLRFVSERTPMETACDVGSGFGRMSLVLREFCERVIGVEREAKFVDRAQRLIPSVEFIQTLTLTNLGLPSQICNFVLTFTVLQHLIDAEARKFIEEIKRITRKGGFSLFCEETDPNHVTGEPTNPFGKCCIGRDVETYARLMEPFALIKTSVREIEPGFPGRTEETYMLFHNA